MNFSPVREESSPSVPRKKVGAAAFSLHIPLIHEGLS